jgi:hypothetical protein
MIYQYRGKTASTFMLGLITSLYSNNFALFSGYQAQRGGRMIFIIS